ncbi:hypothetical protein MUG91_G121n17 [Manis pentadactyla]|nr:hypothetical protein MUG91_G121n17 [Manis pentadactyla]
MSLSEAEIIGWDCALSFADPLPAFKASPALSPDSNNMEKSLGPQKDAVCNDNDLLCRHLRAGLQAHRSVPMAQCVPLPRQQLQEKNSSVISSEAARSTQTDRTTCEICFGFTYVNVSGNHQLGFQETQ